MTPDETPTPATKFCPQCEGEFVAELDTCPDCNVALSLTPPVEPPHPKPVEVFTTYDRAQLPLAQATLNAAGIEHEEVQRDLSSSIMGSVKHEMAILVSVDDAERAKKLLAEMDDGKPELPY